MKKNPGSLRDGTAVLLRMKHDDSEAGPYRLEFELDIGKNRKAILDLGTLLDTLRFAQDHDLMSPLPESWWTEAYEYRIMPTSSPQASDAEELARLDKEFASFHYNPRQGNLACFKLQDGEDGPEYMILLLTLVQCIDIAEQIGCVPRLDLEWKAKEFWPDLRGLIEIEKPSQSH